MRLNLQQYALAAEVLGGLAVVATLVFLVIETRENTNAIQAQTYQSLTAELNENRRDSATPEMTDIYLKFEGSGLGSLSDHEQYRLMMDTEGKWGVYESAFYARERDVLGEDEWVRFDNAICRNFSFDQSLWVSQSQGLSTTIGGISTNITPKFKAYVESSCN